MVVAMQGSDDDRRSGRMELAGEAGARVVARALADRIIERVRAANGRQSVSRARDRTARKEEERRGQGDQSGRTTVAGDSGAPLPYHSGCEPTDGGV